MESGDQGEAGTVESFRREADGGLTTFTDAESEVGFWFD